MKAKQTALVDKNRFAGKVVDQLEKDMFIQKVLESQNTMYHMAKTVLQQDQDCEDAVQEAIITAYEKLGTLREERYFKTWLIRILLNTCYKMKTSGRASVPYEEYFASEAETVKEDYSELYLAIRRLPEKIRVTVVLFYVEGYSVEEIREILKIPAGTVKSRLSKGRKLLKKQLNEMEVLYGTI